LKCHEKDGSTLLKIDQITYRHITGEDSNDFDGHDNLERQRNVLLVMLISYNENLRTFRFSQQCLVSDNFSRLGCGAVSLDE
jgi:hypothetical protein